MSTSERVSLASHRLGFHHAGFVTVLLAFILLPSIAFADDQIAFTCSGNLWRPSPNWEAAITDKSVTIELNERFVETFIGKFPIKRLTDRDISFGSSNWEACGSIDRISGSLSIYDGTGDSVHIYNLKCVKTKPLL